MFFRLDTEAVLPDVFAKTLRLFFVCVFLLCGSFAYAESNVDEALRAKTVEDVSLLQQYDEGLESVLSFIEAESDIFLQEKTAEIRMFSREEKEVVWNTWQRLLDYFVALDAVKQNYKKYYKIKSETDRANEFAVFYTAFLMQYKYAMEFINIIENDSSFDVILNQPVPEIGLKEDTYAGFKFHFLNVKIATEFVAQEVLYKIYGESEFLETGKMIDTYRKFIWKIGAGKGELLTFKNALSIAKKTGFSVVFPVQKGVSEWMGGTKVWRQQKYLISLKQIAEMQEKLQPGDIMLQRREWYLSNIGLPGFWTHAALYIGSKEERQKFFKDTPALSEWIKDEKKIDGGFEALLLKEYPDAYATSIAVNEKGYVPRVIEAISPVVAFTTLEKSAKADSVIVLRPRLSKLEKAKAIYKAFHYSGRPYDFNFDFLTDDEIVCSELVYKVYEPRNGYVGLKFPIKTVLGRNITAPNDIAAQFTQQFGTDKQQTDFVVFYDGYEKENKAVVSNVEEFNKSWTRPKWHILVQE